MILRLFLAIIVIGFCWYALARYRSQKPEQQKKLLIKYLVIGVGAFLVLMTLTGRASWIGAAFGGALVLAQRLLPLAIKFLPALNLLGKKSFIPTGIPTVKTKYLRIEVDYLTGEINGKVISGPHEGSMVKQLAPTQVQELLNYYRGEDMESFNLLNSYLSYRQNGQAQPGQSQYQQSSGSAAANTDISMSEAQQILGVTGEATREEIITAHKKLIQKLHPDRGGNDYLAAKINQAKDLLAGRK